MSNESTGFLIGLLVGGIIGAAVGFLFAPQPGKETREQIKGKTEELIARGKEIVEEGREVVREAVEEGKEATAKVRADLEAKFGEEKEKAG